MATAPVKFGASALRSVAGHGSMAVSRAFGVMPTEMVRMWAFLQIFSVVLLVFAGGKVAHGDSLTSEWAWPMWIVQLGFACTVPWAVVRAMSDARRMLSGRAAPVAAMRLDSRASCHALLLAWIGTSLPLVIFDELGGGGPGSASWTASPSLLALVLALCVVQAAAWQGWLHVLGCLAPVPLLVGLALWGWDGGLAEWRRLGPLTHALMAASLPVTLAWLGRRLEAIGRASSDVRRPSPRWRFAALSADLRMRGQFVDADGIAWLVVLQLVALSAVLLTHSGRHVTVWSGVGLLLLTVFCQQSLTVWNLHWRWALLPGRRFRGGLGRRIVVFTLLRIVAILAAAGLLALPVALFAGASWQAILDWSATVAAPMLNDLGLAVAVAACLRGRMSSAWSAGTVVLLALAWAAGALLWTRVLGGQPQLWVRGCPHELGTLALTAAFMLLADHAWAKVDIGQIMREREAAAQRARNSWTA